ncbi:MAG: peptidase S8, partial [Candidatus Competibacter sp.]
SGCDRQPASDCRQLLAGRLNIEGAKSLLFKGVEGMSHPNKTRAIDPSIADRVCSLSPLDGISKPEGDMKSSGGQALSSAEKILNDSNQFLAYPTVNANNSNCSCNCSNGEVSQLVFALGKLGFDFGIEARRDSINQNMQFLNRDKESNPYDPAQLLEYLKTNPWDAAALIWTLNLDANPIYAIKPSGAFASEIYKRLQSLIAEQSDKGIERVSIPGRIAGSAKLTSGQIVPVIEPDLRGMYGWGTETLIKAVCANSEKEDHEQCEERVGNFFVRVYEELRNLGLTPQDRALNYAATNALLVAQIFKDAIKENLVLGRYEVEQSPICRPESNCWDIKLTFFDPQKIFEKASKIYLMTVDVSDTVPVMVGTVRSWFVYIRP